MKAFDIRTHFWKQKGFDDSYNQWIRIRQMELGMKDLSVEQWIMTRQMELGTRDPYAQWIQSCQMESGM